MFDCFYSIFCKLSSLHVVPYYKWTDERKLILSDIMGDTPYFITHDGNIIIGTDAIESIQENTLCLQAHIDHPGGTLYYDEANKHFYASWHGVRHNNYLIGRTVGIFGAGNHTAIKAVEIQHCHENEHGDVSIYFDYDDEVASLYESGTLLVHELQAPTVTDTHLINWNLDDLIHVAFIVTYILMHPEKAIVGILTVNEEVGHKGIAELFGVMKEKQLSVINFDVIDEAINTGSDFGIRASQAQTDLLKFLPESLRIQVKEQMISPIDRGICEGVSLVRNEIKSLSIFLKIENFHNAIPIKKILPERIARVTLEAYFQFSMNLIDQLERNPMIIQNSTKKSEQNGLSIEYIDYSERIIDIIRESSTYADYLANGLPAIQKIFIELNIEPPNLSQSQFMDLKTQIEMTNIPVIDESKVIILANQVVERVASLFHCSLESLVSQVNTIKVRSLILGKFNACNNAGKERWMLFSLDQIKATEVERILVHEMVHYISAPLWQSKSITSRERLMLEEGLAVCLSSEICGIELYESLGFSEVQCISYQENYYELQRQLYDYIAYNHCKTHRGKKHRYFMRSKVNNPFYANVSYYPRYGYFIAANEIKKCIKEERHFETLLY